MFGRKTKPVTLITGYLGAGKTTVLNEIIKNRDSRKTAVIINDMGSINLDASFIRHTTNSKDYDSMVELSNGCICCTLQDAFMKQIQKIASQPEIDRILVEASGISDPSSIAAGFLEYQKMGLCKEAYLDSVVCVVDADRIYTEFLKDLTETEDEEKQEETEKEQDPDIINLVMDQIEFCNVILLNKCDLLPVMALEQVRKTLRTLQKEAEIIECIQGKVNLDRIFQNKKFDYEKVLYSARIQEQLARGAGQETEDVHGIQSFVYEEKQPFDYDKFMNFLEEDYPETMIRAKGYVWFADDDIHVQLFEQAGRNASVTIVSNWLAAFPEQEQKQQLQEYPEALEDWDETYGDRMNQIVFIGKNISREQVENGLNQCLRRKEQEEKPVD